METIHKTWKRFHIASIVGPTCGLFQSTVETNALDAFSVLDKGEVTGPLFIGTEEECVLHLLEILGQ